jgi:hypothetical protein
VRALLIVALAALASGCALTHEQVVQRAKAKTNTELCMASIQFPQYGDVIAAELASRSHSCNWELTAAQVEADGAARARRAAAIQAATASINATQASAQLPTQMALVPINPAPAIAPMVATAYFTGKQEMVQTVTYQSGWNCEYNYAGRTFWRTFVGSCPSSVQVR